MLPKLCRLSFTFVEYNNPYNMPCSISTPGRPGAGYECIIAGGHICSSKQPHRSSTPGRCRSSRTWSSTWRGQGTCRQHHHCRPQQFPAACGRQLMTLLPPCLTLLPPIRMMLLRLPHPMLLMPNHLMLLMPIHPTLPRQLHHLQARSTSHKVWRQGQASGFPAVGARAGHTSSCSNM